MVPYFLGEQGYGLSAQAVNGASADSEFDR
jgi:hypothetical protein